MSSNDIVKKDESAPALDVPVFDADLERETQLKQAYPADQFDQVLKFDQSLLKAEWEAYHHKVKLLEPIYKERSEFIKKIPGFWLKVLTHDPSCSNHIDAIDRDALAHLEDLTVEHDPKDPRNVTFHFHFAKANPYFSDRILTKKFTIISGDKPTTTNGSGPKPHPMLVEMNEKYDLERRCNSTPVTINWASDEHNLVAKKPCLSRDEIEHSEEELDINDAFGSFFNFFSFEEDRFELHSALLEVHSKALDLYAGIVDIMPEDPYGGLTDDEEEEEDEDPNQVVDLESDSNDEPKKKRAKIVP